MDSSPEMAPLRSSGEIFRLNSANFHRHIDSSIGGRHGMIKEMDFFSDQHREVLQLSSQDHDSKDGSTKFDAGISVSIWIILIILIWVMFL